MKVRRRPSQEMRAVTRASTALALTAVVLVLLITAMALAATVV